jgi:hypothetical protein
MSLKHIPLPPNSITLDDMLTTTVFKDTYQPYQPTIEELERMDQYRREKDLKDAEHNERMEALKTFFPRGHAVIPNLHHMIDIARENQLNPLYEQVLKDFDEAQSALHRAVNKLASAVKITDSDEIAERAKNSDINDLFSKVSLNANYGKFPTHSTHSMNQWPSINQWPSLIQQTPPSTSTSNSSNAVKEVTTKKKSIINWLKSLIK